MSSKARELANLGNAFSDGALSNRNLVINGAMQVSQRGDFSTATSVSNNTYYLDRWKIAAGVSATVTHTGAWQRVDATSSGTTTLRCRQQLEAQDITRFAGQQVTLSAKVKSNSANARLNLYADSWLSGTGNPTHSGNGQEETLTYTVTLPSGSISICTIDVGFDGPLSADVSISSGDYFEITEVQLEVGDTATPFEHRSYGQELARCMRYYERVPINGGSTFSPLALGVATQTTQLRGVFEYKQIKRIDSPTLVTSAASDFLVDWSTGGIACTSVGIDRITSAVASISFNVSGGLSANQCSRVIQNFNANTLLAFDAEL